MSKIIAPSSPTPIPNNGPPAPISGYENEEKMKPVIVKISNLQALVETGHDTLSNYELQCDSLQKKINEQIADCEEFRKLRKKYLPIAQ